MATWVAQDSKKAVIQRLTPCGLSLVMLKSCRQKETIVDLDYAGQ